MSSPAELPSITITDGLKTIGFVVEQPGGRYEAVDNEGRGLGMFPSQAAAVDAVLRGRRQGSSP